MGISMIKSKSDRHTKTIEENGKKEKEVFL